MSITLHTLGLPRIGKARELKTALEGYWKGGLSETDLAATAREVRGENWRLQNRQGMSMVNVGDFSLYDHVLDTSFLVGHIAPRFAAARVDRELDRYFGAARGLADQHIEPGAMTKWFDTNYHYIVPEIGPSTRFEARPAALVDQIREAREGGYTPKVQLLGPVTYLYLSRGIDGFPVLSVLEDLLSAFRGILTSLAEEGIRWVQIDEPILVLDTLNQDWRQALARSYAVLGRSRAIPGTDEAAGSDSQDTPKLLLTTYFEDVEEELETLLALPVDGIHLDYQRNKGLLDTVLEGLGPDRVLSLGVVDGRSPWRENIPALAKELAPLYQGLGERLWLAPSCNLLHLPWSIDGEDLPRELEGVLGFGVEKLQDLSALGAALEGHSNHLDTIQDRTAPWGSEELEDSADDLVERQDYSTREALQAEALELPSLPTTTIGSFPQTREIRSLRGAWSRGELGDQQYQEAIRDVIRENIRIQEEIGLDVLVHGEPERSDMVSFFADRLEGVWASRSGWVQSYGSRCVKPPVIYKPVSRKPDLGWEWVTFAQSLTKKPVKGMLTGPVTILKWSFAPPNVAPQVIANNIARALREEVLELETQGIAIIQIDEPAFREVLPLKRSRWSQALDWAARAFRLSHSGVKSETQIHSHMCYSDFNSIFQGIKAMDADVISIETSRSKGELFAELAEKGYTQGLGPGVYDIHSPLIPRTEEIRERLERALAHLDPARLWVNPDCGLKTRTWQEARPALEALVAAARQIREARKPRQA